MIRGLIHALSMVLNNDKITNDPAGGLSARSQLRGMLEEMGEEG